MTGLDLIKITAKVDTELLDTKGRHMPYIPSGHKPRLRPHLKKIKQCIVKKLGMRPEDRDAAWTYLRHVGVTLIIQCVLAANVRMENRIRLRYWTLAFAEAVFMHMFRELKRRRKILSPSLELGIGSRGWYTRLKRKELADTSELDELIDNLTREIISISAQDPQNIAFVELCNYSLTTIGPRLMMEVYKKDFNRELVQFLAFFWTKVAEDFYEETAAPYEDKQILVNGDCGVFAEMERRLGKV